MVFKRSIVYVFLILSLILASCNLPSPTPAATQASGGTATLTLTPTPTPTQATPNPLQTPKDVQPAASFTPTEEPPTPTGTVAPGTYTLDLIYDWESRDENFEYQESMKLSGTFKVANDRTQEGTGTGTYSQGLHSLNTAFDCGLPVTAQVSMDIKGTTDTTGRPILFHQSITIKFQPLISTSITCSAPAAKISISMPLTGSTDILNQRAVTFPWSDYKINPSMGLYSIPIEGEGIDWKKTGSGDLTITIRPQSK